MSLTCESITPALGSFSLIRHCDIVKDGSLRIATPFKYPDGSLIDVFLEEKPDLLTSFRISDKGQTTAYLLDLQIKHWATQRRKLLVSDICKSLDVEQHEGVFRISVESNEINSLSSHIVRLAQACIRVADLAFTQRLQTQSYFAEDVEEFVASTALSYESRFGIIGKFQNQVEFDFMIRGNRLQTLIQTISAPTNPAHNLANEVFRKWYDISNVRAQYQCVTVYDSTRDNVMRGEDLERLAEHSVVIAFPAEEEQLKSVIAA